MHTCVTIRRPSGPLRGSIALPPSKSVANRALILAALAGDPDCVKNIGEAEDTVTLRDRLRERSATLHCGDGGTTLRFLLAWACVQEGAEHFITGNARLLQRPHGTLVQALRELGADITEVATGFRVRGKRMKGGTITLHAPESSQFISALLLVAPSFSEGLHLRWTGLRLSTPYVRMTLEILKHFGARLHADDVTIGVESGTLVPKELSVPADWSAASFWYQIAALATDAHFTLPDLDHNGLQGDQHIAALLGSFTETALLANGTVVSHKASGPKVLFQADLKDTPDLFQPLAFTLAALGRSAEFTGLHNLPLKETDRLKAVAEALATLGCEAHYEGGLFNLQGPITNLDPPPFDPQGDHRMAMSLAPLALVCNAITILHPEVVAKSYPGFWEDLRSVGFSVF
ncbi:MAG: 3-phosphoshikimate 1-carboxyvinyltransferase [Flavobacteriales bacterium]|nr:3-phosphoshikimate 1-carboxyvinyltransferase [Flavobacteriales bacterium]